MDRQENMFRRPAAVQQGAMEGAHVGEVLVLLLLIVAAVTEVVATMEIGLEEVEEGLLPRTVVGPKEGGLSSIN